MPLPVPVLDDLNFDALVDEARELIPRYAPAWTDHNPSNVGPTLIDLVAFIVDQQIWATGFLSDAHIESFAALLGERVSAAQPATGMVWPDADAIHTDESLPGANIASGAKLSCIEQPEMGFVLAHDMHVSRAQLLAWSLFDGSATREFTHRKKPQDDKPVTVFVEDGEVAPIILRFDRPVVETSGGAEAYPVALGFELAGSTPDAPLPPYDAGSIVVDYRTAKTGLWQRATLEHDGTCALTRTGLLRIRLPELAQNLSKLKHEIRISTRNRVHPLPPVVTRIALNVASVRQCDIRAARVIGDPSTGEPDQRYDLDVAGVASGNSIRIQVVEDGELRDWQVVDDLSTAHSASRVYALSRTNNQAIFGNGVNGMIPPRGAQLRHLDYEVTNGTDGNLAAGLGWHFPAAPLAAAASRFGENRAALAGGRNRTSLDELQRKARLAATRRDVLLTDEALENSARAIDSLALAEASVVAHHHPAMPCRSVPGNRSLVLTPQRPAAVDPADPVPDRYIRAVRRVLDRNRVIGEHLHFTGAERIVVRVRARVRIEDGYDAGTVVQAVRQRLDARLSDIQIDPDVSAWPVGRDVTVSEVRTLIANIDGVIAVTGVRIARRGSGWQKKPIRLPRDSIAVAGPHDIQRRKLQQVTR